MSKSSQNLFTTPFFIFFTYLVAFMMNPSLLGTSRREETGICQKNHQKICHCYIYIKSNRRISCASLSYTITTSLLQKAETEIGRFVWQTNWMIENQKETFSQRQIFNQDIFYIQFLKSQLIYLFQSTFTQNFFHITSFTFVDCKGQTKTYHYWKKLV